MATPVGARQGGGRREGAGPGRAAAVGQRRFGAAPPASSERAPAGCGEEKVVSAKASSQLPVVLAREYSVARFSKKLVCSTAFSISSSQGSGFFSMP